jgi:ComF family protein
MTAALKAAAAAAFGALLPHLCLVCRAPTGGEAGLCPDCWRGIRFIAPPLCERCGLPFEEEIGRVACGACLAEPPAFGAARAVMRYDEASKRLILRFKNADRTHAAPVLARWLARAGAPLVAECDLIVPVPLHWTRLWRRRFNQSALMARALARLAGKPWSPDALARRKPTPRQGGLSRAQRRANVRGAFAVPPGRRALIAGRRVLLIDDVLTTGATLDACARALLRAGAARVDALAVARVAKAD